MIKSLNYLVVSLLTIGLAGCASPEPPRDVSSVSTSNTKTLTDPKIGEASSEGLTITYAEMSMGFDAGCNPHKSFSSELNECSQLPSNVATMAIEHCQKYNKKAVFHGNGTNFIQMTVSNFTCENKE